MVEVEFEAVEREEFEIDHNLGTTDNNLLYSFLNQLFP